MLQVLVGGFIALASGWLLDGGLKRRSRRTIREELELAELVPDTRIAGELQARAYARLEKYMGPSWWSQVLGLRHTLVRVLPVVGVALLVLVASQWVEPAGANNSDRLLRGLIGGAVLGLAWNFWEYVRDSRAIEQRTEQQVGEVTARLEATREALRKYNESVVRRIMDSGGGTIDDERLAALGLTREEYEAALAERVARWVAERDDPQ